MKWLISFILTWELEVAEEGPGAMLKPDLLIPLLSWNISTALSTQQLFPSLSEQQDTSHHFQNQGIQTAGRDFSILNPF